MSKVKFLARDEASKRFREWRKKVNDSQEVSTRTGNFHAVFDKVKRGAEDGDVVLQDILSYYYKSGVERYLNEDYKKYIEWAFISGANGNEFAIDKLQFFMSYAYDEIVENEEFGKIKYYNGIDEYNYIYIIGQRLCEELVAKLNLSAEELARKPDIYQPYRPEYYRDYRIVLNEVIPIVIEKMKKPQEN